MNLRKLIIKNIGCIEDMDIVLDKSLICFFGQIRQGKTTILNSVRWLQGGAYPDDIIRHGCISAIVRLEFDGGSITREWFVDSKTGRTEAHEIVFLRDNNSVPVKRPVEELRRIFGNPFVKDCELFRSWGPADRQKFFVEYLNVDTGELDAEKKDIDDQNKALQAKIDGYGDIPEDVVLAVDKEPIKAAIASRKREHASKVAGWQTELDGLRLEWQSGKRKELQQAKNALAITYSDIGSVEATCDRLQRELAEAQKKHGLLCTQRTVLYDNVQALEAEVASLPDLKPQADALKEKIAQPCDTSDLEAQLSEAAAQDVRVQTYQANLAKIEQRKRDNDLLALNKERLKEIKQLKAQKLAQIAEDSGIKGLSFDENGNFEFEQTSAGLLSTSQCQRLTLELASLFPEAAKIEILDRGESLGVDIFKIIEGAKERKSCILARADKAFCNLSSASL